MTTAFLLNGRMAGRARRVTDSPSQPPAPSTSLNHPEGINDLAAN